MFHKLQKRLTLLYTITTGGILTAVLLVCFFYMKSSLEAKNEALFTSLFLGISGIFQTESFLSDTWLANAETANDLIIHIEDNGPPLFFPGSWEPRTQREELVKRAQNLAQGSGKKLVSGSPTSQQSPILYFNGDHGDSYTAMVLTLSVDSKTRSLLVIQDITASARQAVFQGVFFLVVGSAGIILLFFASWYAVGKTLVPLKENQKQQAEFIAAASHELRSPLAVIQASASALRTDPLSAPAMTLNIEKECVRMGALIKDLLVLAAADSKSWTLSLKPWDGDTLLLDVYETFEPLCRQKEIPLHLSIPQEELPKALCDKNRVIQILTILMDNAISYTPAGKSIDLQIHLQKKFICFTVEDHGKGIPKDEKKFVFQRFYQGDRSRKEKEHFGLGLSIAKELAKLHKGDLLLADTPGGGCCFVLKIPAFTESNTPIQACRASL